MGLASTMAGKPPVSISVKPLGKSDAASMLLKAIEAKDTSGIDAALSLYVESHLDEGSDDGPSDDAA